MTIMLNWIVFWIGSVLLGFDGPFQRERQATSPSSEVTDSGKAPVVLGHSAPSGRPCRLLHRHRRARRLCARPQPHDARLRGPRRRIQPRGRSLRRHQRRTELLPRDGDRRGRSPASPEQWTSSAGSSGVDRARSRCRRSGSSGSPSRCSGGTRRSASVSRRSSSVRCSRGRHAQPRSGDLQARAREQPDPDHPGARRPLRRRRPARSSSRWNRARSCSAAAPVRSRSPPHEHARTAARPVTRLTSRTRSASSASSSGSSRAGSRCRRSTPRTSAGRSSSVSSRSRSGSVDHARRRPGRRGRGGATAFVG